VESLEVRLARIEEHQVFIRGETKDIKKMLAPLVTQANQHAKDIALLQRDDKWRIRIIGGLGGICAGGNGGVSPFGSAGGNGGVSPFGSAGSGGTLSSSGTSAAANSGGGGGGGGGSDNGGGTQYSGNGGGAGAYIDALIPTPLPSYVYAIGAGGSAMTGGARVGNNGGSGVIIVEEFYQ